MESILTSTKKMLGIPEEYEQFDMDLIIHINSVLMVLHQLGIGPTKGYSIAGKTETWQGFMGDDPRLNSVKSYVALKVRLLFDPPTSSAVMESTNRLISELEWRINVQVDPGNDGEEVGNQNGVG